MKKILISFLGIAMLTGCSTVTNNKLSVYNPIKDDIQISYNNYICQTIITSPLFDEDKKNDFFFNTYEKLIVSFEDNNKTISYPIVFNHYPNGTFFVNDCVNKDTQEEVRQEFEIYKNGVKGQNIFKDKDDNIIENEKFDFYPGMTSDFKSKTKKIKISIMSYSKKEKRFDDIFGIQ